MNYRQLKRKVVLDILEQYPDTPSHTLARILFTQSPEFFSSHEDARNNIRLYRGKNGNKSREEVKFKKYFQK